MRRDWRKWEGLDGQWRKEVVAVAAVHEIIVLVSVLQKENVPHHYPRVKSY